MERQQHGKESALEDQDKTEDARENHREKGKVKNNFRGKEARQQHWKKTH